MQEKLRTVVRSLQPLGYTIDAATVAAAFEQRRGRGWMAPATFASEQAVEAMSPKAVAACLLEQAKLGYLPDGPFGRILRGMAALAKGREELQLSSGEGGLGTKMTLRGRARSLAEDPFRMAGLVRALNRELAAGGSPWRFACLGFCGETRFAATELVVFVRAADMAKLAEVAEVKMGAEDGASGAAQEVVAAAKPLPQLEEIVPEARLYRADAEIVPEAEDYRELVRELAGIAGGALVVDDVRCTEGDEERAIFVEARGEVFEAWVRGSTDYADLPPLLACLNRVIAVVPEESRRFVEIVTEDQSMAVAFVTQAEVEALRVNGFVRES